MTTPRVPDLLVERLAKGELPPARAAEVRARLEAEEGGLARLDAIEADDAAVLARLAPEDVAREVRRRVAQAEGDAALSRPRRRWWVALGPALVLALLAVVALPDRTPLDAQDPVPGVVIEDGTRAKGVESRLEVFRREGEVARPLADGEAVHAGDVLQVAYRSAGRRHGLILSVDGRGVVTLHHPTRASGDTRLAPGGRVLLEHAYELDDAPDHETFLFLASDAPLDVVALVALVRIDGAEADVSRLAPGADVHRLRLRKEAR